MDFFAFTCYYSLWAEGVLVHMQFKCLYMHLAFLKQFLEGCTWQMHFLAWEIQHNDDKKDSRLFFAVFFGLIWAIWNMCSFPITFYTVPKKVGVAGAKKVDAWGGGAVRSEYIFLSNAFKNNSCFWKSGGVDFK